MQDKDLAPIIAIEDTARWLHNLAIAGAPKFWRATAALRMICQLLNMGKDAFDKLGCSDRVLQRDEVGNGIQVAESRLRPDYFSHLARRFLA